jgi:ankyrin repeat protein
LQLTIDIRGHVIDHMIQEIAGQTDKGLVYYFKRSGRTALQAAAEGGHLAVVERLIQQKADVNAAASEYSDKTALQAAARGGHLAVVERLIQDKADVNPVPSGNFGTTALQAAINRGHQVIRTLRAAGALK